jgi:sialate O-acetylesterase
MKKIITLILAFSTAIVSFTQIRLPSVLNSNMVLQQQSTVKLWGWCSPAEKIFVRASWNNKTDSVSGTRDANWQINIQTPVAGGPYTITLNGNNQIVLENVLVGEVWVCSGKSNMEMNQQWGLPDVKAELPACYNTNIRFFYVPKQLRFIHRITARHNGRFVIQTR